MLGKLGKLFQPKPRRPYKLFQIEPSLECNLACVMCPWSELRPAQAVMLWDTFSRIAGYLSLAEGVDLTGGGEPTTNPRLVEMVRVARAAGCEVGFSTNGTMLTPDMADSLVSLGLDWISFSVDGATPATYNRIRQGADFETVIDHIRGLAELKTRRGSPTPRLMMVLVMMDQNYRELPDYIDLAASLGIEHVIAKNLDVILHDEDDTRRVFSHEGSPRQPDLDALIAEAGRRARQRGVGLRLYALQPQELPICEHNPLQALFFNWAGDVSPCITLSYAEERLFNGERHHVPCQRYGNIREQSLEEIWDNPGYREFRAAFEARTRLARTDMLDLLMNASESAPADPPPAPEGCRTCYYLYGV